MHKKRGDELLRHFGYYTSHRRIGRGEPRWCAHDVSYTVTVRITVDAFWCGISFARTSCCVGPSGPILFQVLLAQLQAYPLGLCEGANTRVPQPRQQSQEGRPRGKRIAQCGMPPSDVESKEGGQVLQRIVIEATCDDFRE